MKRLLNYIIAGALLLSISHVAADRQARAQERAPSTVVELFAAMKLTETQQAEFKALEQRKRTAQAEFQGLTGEALRAARNAFYAERQKKLKEIFTAEQWTLWATFWHRPQNANRPQPTPQPAHVPAGEPTPTAVPDLSTIPVIDSADLDRFGGWKAKSFEATGFFRTHHDGSRWWLVTPEGHPFLSFGLNHFHAATWNAPYNREHWVERFGAQKPLDQRWMQGFRAEALSLCRRLGITALGIHNVSVPPTSYGVFSTVPWGDGGIGRDRAVSKGGVRRLRRPGASCG